MFSLRHVNLLHRASISMQRSILRLSQKVHLEQHPLQQQFANVRLMSTYQEETRVPNAQSVTGEVTVEPNKEKSNNSGVDNSDFKIIQCLTHIMESNRKADKKAPKEVYKILLDANHTVDKKKKLQALVNILDSVILKGDVHSKMHLEILMSCKEFENLLDVVLNSIPTYSVAEMVSLLTCHIDFQILRKKETARTELMENLLSNLNKLSISVLTMLHQTASQFQSTEVQYQVVKNFGSRWMEIENVTDLIYVMQIITPGTLSDKSVKDGLEEKTLQKVKDLSLEQIVKVMEVLCEGRRRNLSLIKSLAYCLKQKGADHFSMKTVASTFESLSKLNFHDAQLLELLSAHTVRLADDSQTSLKRLTLILNCCAHLRWITPDLEKLLQSYFPKFLKCISPSFRCQAVSNMSKLQCLLESDKEITLNMLKSLNKNDMEHKEAVWLNVALALGWNNWSVQWILESVLEEKFVETIEKYYPFMVSSLRQLDYEASITIPDYKGPRLNVGGQKSSKVTMFNPVVLEVIEATQSLEENLDESLQTGINTPQGHVIDVMVLVDKTGRVIPFTSSDSNCHKVAIKVMKYGNTIRPSMKPTGEIQMWRRHMESLGYKTVLIPYHIWIDLGGKTSKLMYLERTISSSI